MFVSSHSNGTIPSSNDKLNTVASGMLICSINSKGNFGGIPSTPGDLEKTCTTIPRELTMATLRWTVVPESEVRMVD